MAILGGNQFGRPSGVMGQPYQNNQQQASINRTNEQQMRHIGALSTIGKAVSLSCATHIKNLSRHKVPQYNYLPFGAEYAH